MNSAALLYLPPVCARDYPHCLLDDADLARLRRSPALAIRTGWQTSRVGKAWVRQHFPDQAFCLTHKNGHSLLAVGRHKPGVDLESRHRRDFAALAQKTASAEERQILAQSADPEETFYLQWTIKEALVKAQNLAFPTDMAAIGFTFPDGKPRLRLHHPSPEPPWWLGARLGGFYFSAVWFARESLRTVHFYSPDAVCPVYIHGNLPADCLRPLPLNGKQPPR